MELSEPTCLTAAGAPRGANGDIGLGGTAAQIRRALDRRLCYTCYARGWARRPAPMASLTAAAIEILSSVERGVRSHDRGKPANRSQFRRRAGGARCGPVLDQGGSRQTRLRLSPDAGSFALVAHAYRHACVSRRRGLSEPQWRAPVGAGSPRDRRLWSRWLLRRKSPRFRCSCSDLRGSGAAGSLHLSADRRPAVRPGLRPADHAKRRAGVRRRLSRPRARVTRRSRQGRRDARPGSTACYWCC